MKSMKKIIALLIVALVVCAMAVSAFADIPKGSITVQDPKTPQSGTTTYEAYRIFDLEPTTNGSGSAVMSGTSFSGVRYTIATKWEGFFASGAAGAGYIVTTDESKKLPQIVVDGVTKYINITESNVKDFAKAAFAWSQQNNIEADDTNTDGKFTNLDLGYYMVYPKGANLNVDGYTTIVSLTSTNPDQNVVQKAEYPTLVKTDDDASVEVGQIVHYTVTTKVPDMTGFKSFDYWINDEMSNGLTFNDDVSVTIGGIAFNGSDDVTVEKSGQKFTIKLNIFGKDLKVGDPIVVTYSATVNKNAVTKVEKNKATLEYSDNPKSGTSHTTNPPSETTVWSAQIVINKYDGNDSGTKLKDAKFILKCTSVTETDGSGTKRTAVPGSYYAQNASGSVMWIAASGTALTSESGTKAAGLYIAVTDENGAANFDGLEAGTYELYEIVAPAGYNKIEDAAATITVETTSSGTPTVLKYTANVQNNAGSVLPSTGGMGTTIIYIVGALLVIGAGVLLVSKRRAN